MRLFLAIDLPSKSKTQLESQLKNIYKNYPDFKWVSKESFHITLHFFGEVNNPEKIIKKIKDTVYDQAVFYLYSLNADLFLRKKITIYLGFQRSKNLEKLVDSLREELGIHEKMKFVPHLTIGSYRIPSKQQYLLLKKKLKNLKIDIEFKVTKLILFDSLLTSKKPVYKMVAEFPLLSET